jgi:hypothetical protein
MQPKRVFRAVLPAIFGLASLVACTAHVEPSGGGPVALLDGQPASSQSGAVDASSEAATRKLASSDSHTVLPTWAGAIGTWCGPVDEQTLWLTARPGASACDVASKSITGTEGPNAAEALTLELAPAQLSNLPALLVVPARYCSATGAACVALQALLQVDSYTREQGIKGTWAITPPGGAELSGHVDASWCNWDDFLPAHPEAERLARDIKIKEVSVYQGVKIPIVRDTQAVAQRNADLVQQREALVRVFVEPAPGFQSRPLSARLTLQDEGENSRRFEQIIAVSGVSTEQDGTSTFNLELPKDAFKSGTQYSVELRETSRCSVLTGTPVGARFPEQGLAPLAARATGPIKVMLVPVRYEADGSGRLPDVSPQQLTEMTRRLYSMYPTTEVQLSVRDVVTTDRTDLGDMLDQVRELRDADAAPSDLSYYGMVRQADTFGDYCQGTCTTGIAGFGSQNGTATAGMGVGFSETAVNTFVHELGHIYRRPHAPCGGVASPDQSYPYPDAKLGSWGYDLQTRELFDPGTHVDFMSYCSPDWISDYNYQLILERIVVVNQHASFRRIAGSGAPRAFRTLLVGKDGRARWGLDLHPQFQPPGDPISIKALDSAGALLEEVKAFFEDGPDGEQAYFIPAGHADWALVQVPGVPAVPYTDTSNNQPFSR